MYKTISASHNPTIYADKLVAEGILDAETAQKVVDDRIAYLDAEFEVARLRPNKADWLEGSWSGMRAAHGVERRGDTAVDLDTLRRIGESMTTVPEHMTLNSKLSRIIDTRAKRISEGEGLDWATAEHLAFGSLLLEGDPVRLSGQDSCRGTFSQRHAVLVDQATRGTRRWHICLKIRRCLSY